VGENVSGLLNWNGGMVFNEVQTDLENEGYKVQPCVLPACAVNAPHRRDRVWFVAFNAKCDAGGPSENLARKNTKRFVIDEQEGIFQKKDNKPAGQCHISGNVANTDSSMRKRRAKGNKPQEGSESNEEQLGRYDKLHRKDFQKFPSKPPICSGNDGVSNRLDGITFSKWRNESIKAYGNAIVPQIAFQIFKALMLLNKL